MENSESINTLSKDSLSKRKKHAETPLPKNPLGMRLRSWFSNNISSPIRYSKKIPIPIYRWSRLAKRISHLFRMFKHWDELEDLRRFEERATFWEAKEYQKKPQGDCKFNSLESRLRGLKRLMENPDFVNCTHNSESDNVLMFKGRYCKIIREHRQLSKKKLCQLINAHYDIPKMDNYAQFEFFRFYPITVKFLSEFENGKITGWNARDAHNLMKPSGGFLSFWGYGFPYDFFLEIVSKICCVHSDPDRFQRSTEAYEPFKEWVAIYKNSTPWGLMGSTGTPELPPGKGQSNTIEIDFQMNNNKKGKKNDE